MELTLPSQNSATYRRFRRFLITKICCFLWHVDGQKEVLHFGRAGLNVAGHSGAEMYRLPNCELLYSFQTKKTLSSKQEGQVKTRLHARTRPGIWLHTVRSTGVGRWAMRRSSGQLRMSRPRNKRPLLEPGHPEHPPGIMSAIYCFQVLAHLGAAAVLERDEGDAALREHLGSGTGFSQQKS